MLYSMTVYKWRCYESKKGIDFDFGFSVKDGDNEDYWYCLDKKPLCPNAIVLSGGFNTGKTTLFQMLKYIQSIVLNHKLPSEDVNVKLKFLANESIYSYHVIKEGENLTEELNDNKYCGQKSVVQHTSPVVYNWFSKIKFISSIYDTNTDVSLSDINIPVANKILSNYRQYWLDDDCDFYCQSWDKILVTNSTVDFISGNRVKRLPIKRFSATSIYSIYLLQEFYNFALGDKYDILIVDDVRYQGKGKLYELIKAKFFSLPGNTNIGIKRNKQIVTFSNDTYNRTFAQAKKVSLTYCWDL